MCDGTTEQAPHIPDTPSKARLAPVAHPVKGELCPTVTRTKTRIDPAMKSKEWQSADRILPHSAHLPVEVELAGGTVERRTTVSGDWRQVVRWRKVDKEPGDRQRKGK